MKRTARVLLLITLAAELWWLVETFVSGHAKFWTVIYALVITVCFLGLLATGAKIPWYNACARVLTGLLFASSVADRFGWLGTDTHPWVSWGNFSNFIASTKQINSFCPGSWAPALAVLATICESVLAVSLLPGLFPKYSLRFAAALLLIFAASMTYSLGFKSPFPFAVWVLAAGTFWLSAVDHRARYAAGVQISADEQRSPISQS